jgi:hypothetical protein
MGADEFAAALPDGSRRSNFPGRASGFGRARKSSPSIATARRRKWFRPPKARSWLSIREVLDNPALVRSDPYGKGWLVTVNVPDEESTTRNLIPKGLVHEWMREAGRGPPL